MGLEKIFEMEVLDKHKNVGSVLAEYVPRKE